MENPVNTQGTNGDSLTVVLPRSPDVLCGLLVKRRKVGAESREGKLLSNLVKQALWQDDPASNRSWAQHPTHNLPWMMNVQVEALAKGN